MSSQLIPCVPFTSVNVLMGKMLASEECKFKPSLRVVQQQGSLSLLQCGTSPPPAPAPPHPPSLPPPRPLPASLLPACDSFVSSAFGWRWGSFHEVCLMLWGLHTLCKVSHSVHFVSSAFSKPCTLPFSVCAPNTHHTPPPQLPLF